LTDEKRFYRLECSLQSDGEFRPQKPFANPFKKVFLSAPFFTSWPAGYPQSGCFLRRTALLQITQKISQPAKKLTTCGYKFFLII